MKAGSCPLSSGHYFDNRFLVTLMSILHLNKGSATISTWQPLISIPSKLFLLNFTLVAIACFFLSAYFLLSLQFFQLFLLYRNNLVNFLSATCNRQLLTVGQSWPFTFSFPVTLSALMLPERHYSFDVPILHPFFFWHQKHQRVSSHLCLLLHINK